MTPRSRTILRLLSESTPGYTTVERIAEETGAGMRTIHRDLEGLERSLRLRGVRLERRRGFGIRIIDPLPESLLEGIRETRPAGADSGQRPMMVLLYLIIAGDWVKIADIATTLNVSDSTISSDLTVLESWLPEGMELIRHKGTGIRLTSDELLLRLVFLSSFPGLFPMYVINAAAAGGGADASAEERFIDSVGIREVRGTLNRKISIAEEVLGYQFSSASRSLLYAYLFLLANHLPLQLHLGNLPNFRLEVPEVFTEAAIATIASDIAGNTDSPDVSSSEIEILARLLSSCETIDPPESSVADYLGSLTPRVETMLENSLSRLEEKEKIWLHDDRILLNYFRMTVVAAARRIDLGLSEWRELGARPVPDLGDTPVSVVLVSQFMSDFGRVLKEPAPAIVRREINEVALAASARLEAFRSRNSRPLRVKILCYEGLGMSRYLLSLARDAFPAGTAFNNLWEPEFENKLESSHYDLIITTFPVNARGISVLFVNGEDAPEDLRRRMHDAANELEPSGTGDRSGTAPEPVQSGPVFSLSEVMDVINGFFVLKGDAEADPVDQAVEMLKDSGTDPELLKHDFERRESYGSLVFDELNVRILHCRTEGVSEPRAGVIQDVRGGGTILVLAAPITARQSQTHALSEIVIALTEYEDFPEILARGKRRDIQARLMTLFGNRAG